MATNRSTSIGPRVLVLGRPGAGKGTQCARLAGCLGVDHISTGDLFRTTVARDDPLGTRVRGYLESGELVPDGIVMEVVRDRLGDQGTARGFVLDGFPRTVAQAEQLEEMLLPYELDLAIDLVVSPEVARARLTQRLVCGDCGRPNGVPGPTAADLCGDCGGSLSARADDTASTVSRRLALYDEQTDPLVEWLATRGIVARVDGLGTLDEVAQRIDAVCARRLAPHLPR